MTETAPNAGRARRAVGWTVLVLLTAASAVLAYAVLVFLGH